MVQFADSEQPSIPVSVPQKESYIAYAWSGVQNDYRYIRYFKAYCGVDTV